MCGIMQEQIRERLVIFNWWLAAGIEIKFLVLKINSRGQYGTTAIDLKCFGGGRGAGLHVSH